jgi:hypothetical protein
VCTHVRTTCIRPARNTLFRCFLDQQTKCLRCRISKRGAHALGRNPECLSPRKEQSHGLNMNAPSPSCPESAYPHEKRLHTRDDYHTYQCVYMHMAAWNTQLSCPKGLAAAALHAKLPLGHLSFTPPRVPTASHLLCSAANFARATADCRSEVVVHSSGTGRMIVHDGGNGGSSPGSRISGFDSWRAHL